jgi:hypothetical protein
MDANIRAGISEPESNRVKGMRWGRRHRQVRSDAGRSPWSDPGESNNVQPVTAGLRQRILIIRDQPTMQGLAESPGGTEVESHRLTSP